MTTFTHSSSSSSWSPTCRWCCLSSRLNVISSVKSPHGNFSYRNLWLWFLQMDHYGMKICCAHNFLHHNCFEIVKECLTKNEGIFLNIKMVTKWIYSHHFPSFFISHNKIMHIKDIEFLSTRKYINMRRTTHCVLLSHHLSLAHCHSNVCVSSTSNNTLCMQHINTQLYQIHILLEWTIIDTFLIVTAMIVQK